jgi:hypothetical protein
MALINKYDVPYTPATTFSERHKKCSVLLKGGQNEEYKICAPNMFLYISRPQHCDTQYM